MTDPPALAPPSERPTSSALRNLDAQLVAAPSGTLLARVAWDGPPLDPEVLEARAMLAWLR
jgi:hypothetical protein